MRIRLVGLLASALLIGGVPSGAAAQQQGAIAGRVTDRATQRPVPAAQVVLVGTTHGTVTSDSGAFRIPDLAPGQYQVRAQRIGYEAGTQTITVVAGQTTTVDFALQVAAVRLDEVVTTATGEKERLREKGNVVTTVTPSQQSLAASTDLTQVLAGRAAGVTLVPSGGTVGSSTRIRIRGANSVSLDNEPLLIIDGVRANNDVSSTTIGVGGQVPSRLEDINPEDIENIEIVKGPAAAALYGTAAANGVIQITTKQGRPGTPRFRATVEVGSERDITDWPANYAQVGTRLRGRNAGKRTTSCTLDSQSRQICAPIPDSIVSFNPLVQASPFINGYHTTYGLSVDGGSAESSYYLSGNFEHEQGVYEINHARSVSLRANLRSQLRDNLNVSVNTGYVSSRLRLPQNDNNVLGVVSSGLLGSAFDDSVSHGYLTGQTPQEIFAINTRQDIDRFTSGITATWQPLGWLTAVGTAGLDYVNRHDHETVPPNRVNFGSLPQGSRESNPFSIYNYTFNGGVTAVWNPLPNLQSSTSGGVQFNKALVAGTEAFGAQLLGGTGSLNGASSRFSVDETNTDNKTFGTYVREQLSLNDRVYLTGALRWDNNSAFGQNFGSILYPSISASWVVSDESFFPKNDIVSSFRLRTAYGQAGQQPNFRDAITFFQAQTVTVNSSDVPGVRVGGTGNPDLKPERSKETEVGFDAGFFNERVGVQLTYYNRRTEDLLIARTLPPSLGLSDDQFANLGTVTNHGWEYVVNARLLDAEQVKFDLTVNGSINKNRLLDLGKDAQGNPIPPIVFGHQEHREGYPLGGYWDRPILSYEDLNGDGILSRVNCPGEDQIAGGPACEIVVDTARRFLGASLPTRQWAVAPTLQLFQWFTVSALFDHRGGYKLFNNTHRFRCSFGNCKEAVDPNAPLEDQAAVLALLMGSDAGYVEDADFTKLRELSFTLTAPRSLANRFHTDGLSLTIAGRNLATWTKYSGFDPEVNSTPNANFSSSDFLTQPPLRYWTARVNVTW